MRQSKSFTKTSKTTSADDTSVNARFLEQAGYVQKVMAGVYTFLPLGWRVLSKIETIVREEMNALGAEEIFMPSLHPKANWLTTGRWNDVDVLFKVESQHGYQVALGPTHEEIVTPLALPFISSYRDLPKAVYQIQTKFRDEARAKSGLMRGREFRMKDLYSFHTTEEDLEDYYQRAAASYHRVFDRVGLDALYTEASGGTFSKYSHEFQVEVEAGEDIIYVCEGCKLAQNKEIYTVGAVCSKCNGTQFRETKASEVGNIFQLKNKFSSAFDLSYTTEDGGKKPVLMGCYGIGTSRLVGVLVEKYHDDKGIIWPENVAPFRVHVIALPGKTAENVFAASDALYTELVEAGVEVLYDDRADVSAGEKFADSDLIGIPHRAVMSAKTLAQQSVELKKRSETESELISLKDILKYLNT